MIAATMTDETPRATPDPLDAVYVLDDLTIDVARQRVMRADARLDVGGLNFQLLRRLVESGDRVVGFDELMERVWAPAVVNEETVTQRIKLLRQALGDDGRRPRYVRSVRGRGYQLCVAPRIVEKVQACASRQRRLTGSAWAGVAVAFAGAIAIAAGAWMLRATTAPLSKSAVAQDARLDRARYYAGIGQADNNERAIALYEDVVRDAPLDAAANVGLSRALSARMCLYNASPESAARAQTLANAVIARHPEDSAAHAALAYAFDCRGEIDAAIAEYERAVALAPDERADARASLANLYAVKGRLADALATNVAVEKSGAKLRFLDLQIARALDLLGFAAAAEQRYARLFNLYPDNVFASEAYPRFLYTQGRYADAEAALAQALERPPHPSVLLLAGELALVRDDRARAEAFFAQAQALRPHQSLPATLTALYAATPDAAAIAARAQAMASNADDDTADAWLEVALLRRDDRARALDALRRAVAAGFRDGAWLRVTPLFRELAGDPGFADVIDAIARATAAERARVLAAAWLPPDLLTATAAAP